MKRLAFFALVLALVCSCESDNKLTAVEKAEGWELLFNGTDLTGWRNFNSDTLEGWAVEDGCLKASGEGSDASGYIVYDQPFDDFELSIDWKLSKGGNSGIIYHVLEGDNFEVPYVTGPEYQLIDKAGWEERNAPEKLYDWQSLGADYSMHLADLSKAVEHPAGEWNNSRIVFCDRHVQHYLNDVLICEFDVWTDDWFERKANGKWADCPDYGLSWTGLLCLQDHGDPAWFKNIKIRRFPKEYGNGREVELFNGKDLTGWIPFGDGKWSVDEEGNLVIESGDNREYGYLGTRAYYQDFDFCVEFKECSDGNSGLFFHSYIEGYNKVHGWQCEVAPFNHDTGGIYESYGRGWLQQIPDEKENILKPDDWNTLRLRVIGNHVETWLNGVQMSDLREDIIAQSPGRIMLQLHDNADIKVLWRNFKLVEY